MKSELLKFIKSLILFTLVASFFQYIITEYTFGSQGFHCSVFVIYVFLLFITLLSYILVLYINTKKTEYTGYAFITGSLFKMVFSVLFLLPFIIKGEKLFVADVIAFFIPYFLFLSLETVFVIQLLQTKK